MGDAEIIPIGTRGRPGRGAGKQPSSAARGLAPATARSVASKPPSRPRKAAVGSAAAALPEPVVEPVHRSPASNQDRDPTGGIPAGDWLAAIQHGAREVFGDQWEPQLAQLLA